MPTEGIFLLIVWKRYKKRDSISKSTFFLKISLLICRMLFWQLRLKHSIKRLNFVCLMSQIQGRSTFGHFSPKRFHRARREQVRQPGRKSLLSRPKVFLLNVRKNWQNTLLPGKKKNLISPSFVENNFQSIAERQLPTEGIFLLIVWKRYKKRDSFSKSTFFPQNFPPDM